MGTIITGTIVDRARNTLLETGMADVRWQRLGDLLTHFNTSQREIVAAKPDAFVRNASVQLGAGAKQTLPADGVQFFNVEHNLGLDGNSPGGAILLADRSFLTRANRNWMNTSGAAIEHFVHDQRDPKTYYVYPRPVGTWYVNLLYSAVPPAVLAANIDTAAISVDDLYDAPIHDYIVGYALLKNSKAGDPGKANYFLSKFYNFIGKKWTAQMQFAPLDAEGAEQTPNAEGKP